VPAVIGQAIGRRRAGDVAPLRTQPTNLERRGGIAVLSSSPIGAFRALPATLLLERHTGAPRAARIGAISINVVAVAVAAQGGIGRHRGDGFPGLRLVVPSVGHGPVRQVRNFRVSVRGGPAPGSPRTRGITTPPKQSPAPRRPGPIATLIAARRVVRSPRQRALMLEQRTKVPAGFWVPALLRPPEGNRRAGEITPLGKQPTEIKGAGGIPPGVGPAVRPFRTLEVTLLLKQRAEVRGPGAVPALIGLAIRRRRAGDVTALCKQPTKLKGRRGIGATSLNAVAVAVAAQGGIGRDRGDGFPVLRLVMPSTGRGPVR
jgi:hypothetical protein